MLRSDMCECSCCVVFPLISPLSSSWAAAVVGDERSCCFGLRKSLYPARHAGVWILGSGIYAVVDPTSARTVLPFHGFALPTVILAWWPLATDRWMLHRRLRNT
ncbi:hypothetical protein LXA43DRAFT_492436 [Ganoderma leucocontextum]|nr:hypothetical protein LXA43DRAFT_492436 [Ganoderma leucocontextum]